MIYPARGVHDTAVWTTARMLRLQGIASATEVGVPGGRIDILASTDRVEWSWLIEVKTRLPHKGVDQLLRYARAARDAREPIVASPVLTLIVSPELATADLAELAACAGVDLLTLDFAEATREHAEVPWPDGHYFYLPSIHPISAERIRAANRKWNLARRRAA